MRNLKPGDRVFYYGQRFVVISVRASVDAEGNNVELQIPGMHTIMVHSCQLSPEQSRETLPKR